jgi:hypothetical protein
MSSILYTGGMVFLWLIALLNGTGLGNAYHTTEYARILALAVAVLLFIWEGRFRKGWLVPQKHFLVLICMVGLFVTVSYLKGYKFVSLNYLWAFLVTYIVSRTRPKKEDLYMAGTAYAVLGLAILFIWNYMTALSGWNPNSIAMIGLFSFLMFTIPYYGIRDVKSMVMITLVGAAYVFLIWPTGSRSCCFAVVLSLLIGFRFLPFEKIFRKNWRIRLALHIPLIVALLGCIVATTADMGILNAWSMEEFGKSMFSGREEVWKWSLTTISDNLLFGTGHVDSGYYHNSAIACLVAYGVVGYSLWIGLFEVMLNKTLAWWDDICVAGAISVFFIIFWQQSVELGMFAASPNIIPYAIIGVLLARVKMLKEQECQKLV